MLWVSLNYVFHIIQAFRVATPITFFHSQESQTGVGVVTPTTYGVLGNDAVP